MVPWYQRRIISKYFFYSVLCEKKSPVVAVNFDFRAKKDKLIRESYNIGQNEIKNKFSYALEN
jgi:hypothetical protein